MINLLHPALPLSTKGVRGDAEEQAAGIIKHKASCWEPCYETWPSPGWLAQPWERSEG